MPARAVPNGNAPPHHGTPGARKLLHAVDAELTPASRVFDIAELTDLAEAAVDSGGGHVLNNSHVVFPNGAITLVLILAESHLAIHTWPEDNMIAIDLFSCGAIDSHQIIRELAATLHLANPRTRQLVRGTG